MKGETAMAKPLLPLVIIGGPTGVGKSETAVTLAKKIGGEIISADSMQVYRGMDIGTAKLTKEEMGGVPHHMIDILEPTQAFNIAKFTSMTAECIRQITDRGHIPLLVGGTGFYIRAVLYGTLFSEEDDDPSIRLELEKKALEEGNLKLHAMLEKIDPASAAAIPPGNVKRVIRAIEYYRKTGELISVHNERERAKEAVYNAAYFALTCERGRMYSRIDLRVDRMAADGLTEEVKALAAQGLDRHNVSMQGLGYRQILEYLDGEITLDEALNKIKQETRHFAKRQLTWLRKEKDVIWLDKDTLSSKQIIDEMIRVLILKGIIPAGKEY